MPSNKRLKDLEYNVFKKDMDSNNTPDNIIGTKDSGCLTTLGAIIVFIVVIVCIVGFMQVGKNGPSLTCAAPGCSNRLKPGSNYCWLHSNQSNTKRSTSGSSSSSSSSSSLGNGSVIGGSSSSEPKKRNKIWNGDGNSKSKNSTSTGNSSSSGSSSSSGGGSSTGN